MNKLLPSLVVLIAVSSASGADGYNLHREFQYSGTWIYRDPGNSFFSLTFPGNAYCSFTDGVWGHVAANHHHFVMLLSPIPDYMAQRNRLGDAVISLQQTVQQGALRRHRTLTYVASAQPGGRHVVLTLRSDYVSWSDHAGNVLSEGEVRHAQPRVITLQKVYDF